MHAWQTCVEESGVSPYQIGTLGVVYGILPFQYRPK